MIDGEKAVRNQNDWPESVRNGTPAKTNKRSPASYILKYINMPDDPKQDWKGGFLEDKGYHDAFRGDGGS